MDKNVSPGIVAGCLFLLLGLIVIPFTPWFQRECAFREFRSAPSVSGAVSLTIRYPGSDRAREAEAIIWTQLSRSSSLPDLQAYKQAFPDSPHARAAAQMVDRLTREAARKELDGLMGSHNMDKMGAFLIAHPDLAETGRDWLLQAAKPQKPGQPSVKTLRLVFMGCVDNRFRYCLKGPASNPAVEETLTTRFKAFGFEVVECQNPRMAQLVIESDSHSTGEIYGRSVAGYTITDRDSQSGQVITSTVILKGPYRNEVWRQKLDVATPKSVNGSVEVGTRAEYASRLSSLFYYW